MPATNYPNGVKSWTGGGQRHAWTNRPHPREDGMHRALCGAAVLAEPARGLFNTDAGNSCALCKVKARSHRPPRWTW